LKPQQQLWRFSKGAGIPLIPLLQPFKGVEVQLTLSRNQVLESV